MCSLTHHPPSSLLLLTHLRGEDQTVEIHVQGETLMVHRNILTAHCEYFSRCLKEPWTESQGVITFTDIEPKYLALFIGVAYSHSSIVPMAPPVSCANPQAQTPKTPLRDFVEVYKLCDRFISPVMGDYIEKCIKIAIGDGHKALYRSPGDDAQQQSLTRYFADGYEAFELCHPKQKVLADTLLEYFCEGVGYGSWHTGMEEVCDRPRFVAGVSRGFAKKLEELKASRKVRKRELNVPN